MLKLFSHRAQIVRVGICFLLAPLLAGAAEEKIAVLKVGSEVYSNVVVTSVTATDIYFRHAGGMGNAKLKKLSPELQKHFKYDPEKAGEVEQHQREANARFHEMIATNVPAPGRSEESDADPVAKHLYAHSFRGEHVPAVVVEQWLKAPPDMADKFVLLLFWSATSEPCKAFLPRLDKWYGKYSDRMGVIALTGDSPEQVQSASLDVDFPIAFDSQQRTATIIEVLAVPHIMLVDRKGIVRYEGPPDYLDEKGLTKLLDKYWE
jgi:thiol-disulfide isomerase/thioredoxin